MAVKIITTHNKVLKKPKMRGSGFVLEIRESFAKETDQKNVHQVNSEK